MRMFPVGARPECEPRLMECIAGRAMRSGTSVLSAIYDALLEEEGKALLYFPIYNYTGMNLDVVREMLVHPRAIVGLGDAGAHVGTVCDASMPAFVVGQRGRPRSTRSSRGTERTERPLRNTAWAPSGLTRGTT